MGKNVPAKSLHNASHAASRFSAALISAWFSLEILHYKATAKVHPKQIAQDQQQHIANTGTLRTAKILDSKVSPASPPVVAGKTVDLTFLAVTRALDSLLVALYRRSDSSFGNIAPASSTLKLAIPGYADTFIFALSSGTVVCLHPGAISSLSIPRPEF